MGTRLRKKSAGGGTTAQGGAVGWGKTAEGKWLPAVAAEEFPRRLAPEKSSRPPSPPPFSSVHPSTYHQRFAMAAVLPPGLGPEPPRFPSFAPVYREPPPHSAPRKSHAGSLRWKMDEDQRWRASGVRLRTNSGSVSSAGNTPEDMTFPENASYATPPRPPSSNSVIDFSALQNSVSRRTSLIKRKPVPSFDAPSTSRPSLEIQLATVPQEAVLHSPSSNASFASSRSHGTIATASEGDESAESSSGHEELLEEPVASPAAAHEDTALFDSPVEPIPWEDKTEARCTTEVVQTGSEASSGSLGTPPVVVKEKTPPSSTGSVFVERFSMDAHQAEIEMAYLHDLTFDGEGEGDDGQVSSASSTASAPEEPEAPPASTLYFFDIPRPPSNPPPALAKKKSLGFPFRRLSILKRASDGRLPGYTAHGDEISWPVPVESPPLSEDEPRRLNPLVDGIARKSSLATVADAQEDAAGSPSLSDREEEEETIEALEMFQHTRRASEQVLFPWSFAPSSAGVLSHAPASSSSSSASLPHQTSTVAFRPEAAKSNTSLKRSASALATRFSQAFQHAPTATASPFPIPRDPRTAPISPPPRTSSLNSPPLFAPVPFNTLPHANSRRYSVPLRGTGPVSAAPYWLRIQDPVFPTRRSSLTPSPVEEATNIALSPPTPSTRSASSTSSGAGAPAKRERAKRGVEPSKPPKNPRRVMAGLRSGVGVPSGQEGRRKVEEEVVRTLGLAVEPGLEHASSRQAPSSPRVVRTEDQRLSYILPSVLSSPSSSHGFSPRRVSFSS